MFKHGLFILKNRSVNVWSEQYLCAGPGLPAYRTGECISLVRGLGAILICVPGMVGGLCLSEHSLTGISCFPHGALGDPGMDLCQGRNYSLGCRIGAYEACTEP